MAGLAAAGAAKSMGAIVRGFDTRYETERRDVMSQTNGCDVDNNLTVSRLSGQQPWSSSNHLGQSL